MNVYEKLLAIQTELKAPKSQFNKFGGYAYRSCEDILESVKPLLAKYKASLFLSDEIVERGSRIYVMATATLVDVEKPEDRVCATAYAREEESKKGMDGSQVTGAASSYARKYALNGLFDIDDNKDSDSTNDHGKGQNPGANSTPRGNEPRKQQPKPKHDSKKQKISDDMRARLNTAISQCRKLTGIETDSIIKTIEKGCGKSIKDFDEADGEATLKLLNKWQQDYTEGLGD